MLLLTNRDMALSQHFKLSWTRVKSIMKKFKECCAVENKLEGVLMQKISKTLERKTVVSKKTIIRTLNRNYLGGCRARKPPRLQKRPSNRYQMLRPTWRNTMHTRSVLFLNIQNKTRMFRKSFCKNSLFCLTALWKYWTFHRGLIILPSCVFVHFTVGHTRTL